MGYLQFCLAASFIIFAFSEGIIFMKSVYCKSVFIQKSVERELEMTVNSPHLSWKYKASFGCGFILKTEDDGHKGYYLKTFKTMKLGFRLPTGLDYE